MTNDVKSPQLSRTISMLNRVTVARIKLERAEKLSENLKTEIKSIDKSIVSLSDCLIIGDDLTSTLDDISGRIEILETGI